jgi:hypothetical protein
VTTADDTAPRSENGSGWYLYGVVPAAQPPTGLDVGSSVDPRHGVELVAEGAVAGLASKVSLDEFDEARLPERLNDAVWLERKIRAHEQVLERALQSTAVVPFRFCTVYRSEGDLRRFLGERGRELEAVLRSVDGKIELGVKAFVDRDRFAADLIRRNNDARELDERAGVGGGRAYLESRRLEQLVAGELEGLAAEVVGEAHTRLLATAEDGMLGAVQSPELSGRTEPMLMNAAYLVPAGGARLRQAVDELAARYGERGVTFEVTGPWPPYNFVPREVGVS